MKRTTPFKASEDFEKELIDFSRRFKTLIADHSKRISDYFEMSCYNLVIRYYEKKGYELTVQNLRGGKFKFKCSPTGLLKNFSYFKAVKKEAGEGEDMFYIYHNATVQSSFDENVYTTPDIVVSKNNKPSETKDYYATKKTLSYIPPESLISFCEAKHLTPFPELMINFIGTVHELKPDCLCEDGKCQETDHIAPSLLMSGSLGKPTKRIKESFERRYYVNFFDNLFEAVAISSLLTKSEIKHIATLNKKREHAMDEEGKDKISTIVKDIFETI